MARSIADGRYKVDLSADWRPYAEPSPNLRMLGTFTSARGIACALAQRSDGAYVAVQGRMVTMLAQHKMPHAFAAWRASMPGGADAAPGGADTPKTDFNPGKNDFCPDKMPFSAEFDT